MAIPSQFELVTSAGARYAVAVTTRDGAAEDLVEFGDRYWSIQAVDTSDDAIVWQFTLNELAAQWGETLRRCEVFAAAAVRVTLLGFTCAGCGDQPLLRSRADLQDFLRGSAPGRCLRCDNVAARAAERELDPPAQHRRERRQQRGQRLVAEQRARERWEAQRRAQIREAYPLRLEPGTASDRPAAAVRAEAAALSLLAASSSNTAVSAAHDTPRPVAPTIELLTSLLADCCEQDVLRIHPNSPAQAWAWQRSFEQASTEAENFESIGEPERGAIDLLLVRWYAPFGDGGLACARELNRHLVTRLHPDQLSGPRRQELLELCAQLIQHEAIHDFEVRLQEAGYPRLSAAQRERLTEVMGGLAGFLTLAQCSTLAERAIRGAADGVADRRRESHPRWASYAIAWLADIIDKPLTNDLDGVPPAKGSHDTSMITSIVFGLHFGIEPWHASVAAVALAFPDPEGDARDSAEPDITEAVRLLRDPELRIDPHAVYHALERRYQETGGSTRAGISGLIDVIDLYRAAGGSLREALAAAMSATILIPGRRPEKAGNATVASHLAGIMYDAALDSVLGAPPWRRPTTPSSDQNQL